MKIQEKRSFALVVRTSSVFEVELLDLMSECVDAISLCECDSSVLGAAKELAELAENLIDFRSELMLVTQGIFEAARNTPELDVLALRLDDLASQSSEAASSLIRTIQDLIDGV
jgi:hypothetical protein